MHIQHNVTETNKPEARNRGHVRSVRRREPNTNEATPKVTKTVLHAAKRVTINNKDAATVVRTILNKLKDALVEQQTGRSTNGMVSYEAFAVSAAAHTARNFEKSVKELLDHETVKSSIARLRTIVGTGGREAYTWKPNGTRSQRERTTFSL